MSGDQLEETEVDRLGAAVFEQRRLSHMLRQRGAEIETLRSDRERLAVRERKALEREEELRQAVRSRDEKLAALSAECDRLKVELKQAQYEARRDRAQREVEREREREREREALLAASEARLDEVAGHLRRVRASRSWRWGQGLARALRSITLRRNSGRSALDLALERLEQDPKRDGRRPA